MALGDCERGRVGENDTMHVFRQPVINQRGGKGEVESAAGKPAEAARTRGGWGAERTVEREGGLVVRGCWDNISKSQETYFTRRGLPLVLQARQNNLTECSAVWDELKFVTVSGPSPCRR